MRPLSVVILLAGCCTSCASRAEFTLQATPSSPAPLTLNPFRPTIHLREPGAKPRNVVASGFGHEVPLRFVVRQLLPAPWHVRYDQGVDPNWPVSWEGGRPWDYVLRDAVKPLGLRAYANPSMPFVVVIAR